MLEFWLMGFKKIISLFKKIFIVIAIYLLIISLFFYFIDKNKATVKERPTEKNRKEMYKIINDPQLTKTPEGKIIILLYRGMLCNFVGEACTDNPEDGNKNFRNSFFGFISNLIIFPYANPPASGIYWAYSGLQNSGFIPKIYAAEGIGFASIKPIMGIWKIFRDLSYMLLVLILISIGFMIMFRMKLHPQTVISVENSLPRIVVALLMITFSFAISGFLIDLMYIIILILISIFTNLNTDIIEPEERANLFEQYTTGNFFSLLWLAFKNYNFIQVGYGLSNILGGTLKTIVFSISSIILTIFTTKFIYSNTFIKHLLELPENFQVGALTFSVGLGKLLSGVLSIIIIISIMLFISPFILYLLIGFLVALTIIALIFKIFFILLTAYLKIIFYIIISPLLLLLEAIPGKNTFSSWFKNLLAEILIFPLVVGIFLIGYVIMAQFGSENNNMWIPPFLYSIDSSIFPVLFGLGLILIIPDFIKTLKESLGAKGMGPEIGIGTFFGSAGLLWGGATKGMGIFSSLQQTPIIGSLIKSKLKDKKIFGQPIIGPSTSDEVFNALKKAKEERVI